MLLVPASAQLLQPAVPVDPRLVVRRETTGMNPEGRPCSGRLEGGDPIGEFAWKPLLTIVGSVAIFGWALPHLGLFLALPLLVVISALAGDEFHWGEALVNAAILTAGSWVIFIWGLNLTIPLWPSFIAAR